MTDETAAETEFAPAWRPEPGDKIKGTIISITRSSDMGYGPYPILTLQTADGEIAVHSFHSVLRSQLAERRVQRGDEIEIAYLGQKQPKGNGNAYHSYRVTGGNEPEYDWDSELPESERRQNTIPIAPAPIPAPADRVARAQDAAAMVTDDEDDVPF